MTLPVTLADFEAAAAEALSPGPLGYYAGGAADEVTMRDNVEAWRRIALRPRVMVDVSTRDPATTVLGQPWPHPIAVAPTAFHRLATPEAERATATAAALAGSTYCLSTLGTTAPRECTQGLPPGRRWYQLYVFRDRGVTREMVAAAVESGFDALVLTVDFPVLGMRERDLRSGFVVEEATGVPNLLAAGGGDNLTMREITALIDPSLTWADVERFADESGRPVIVKGVLTAEDARAAVGSGAAGVVVSNHGGRQLDTVLSGADALPEVVEAVAGAIDVLVDGGVRRGTDVVKALALGAKAVLVGRPVLWGLTVGGEAGVKRVLDILLAELDIALGLMGVPNARDLGPEHVQRAPWAAG